MGEKGLDVQPPKRRKVGHDKQNQRHERPSATQNENKIEVCGLLSSTCFPYEELDSDP
jgi:hypothetical protein